MLWNSPLPLPENWVAHVNDLQTAAELEGLRQSVQPGCTWGFGQLAKAHGRALGLSKPLGLREDPAVPSQEAGQAVVADCVRRAKVTEGEANTTNTPC